MNVDEFKTKYLGFHPKLYHVAYSLLESQQDAEDVLQEVYSRLWMRRKELEEVKSPEAFAVTMVKHLSLDMIRSSARKYREDASAYETISDTDTPEDQLMNKEVLGQLEAIIEKLPENQRKVIRLRSFNGCAFEEIGEMTGMTAANVRVLLSRARKSIREQFNRLYSHG